MRVLNNFNFWRTLIFHRSSKVPLKNLGLSVESFRSEPVARSIRRTLSLGSPPDLRKTTPSNRASSVSRFVNFFWRALNNVSHKFVFMFTIRVSLRLVRIHRNPLTFSMTRTRALQQRQRAEHQLQLRRERQSPAQSTNSRKQTSPEIMVNIAAIRI